MLLPLLFASVGCATTFGAADASMPSRRRLDVAFDRLERCTRSTLGADGPLRLPLAEAEEDPALAAELAAVPSDVRRTVLAAGLEPALARLLHDFRTGGATVDTAQLARRQAVAGQLASISTQLDATVFEVDCTGDATESGKLALEARGGRRELGLTVASIFVGAIGGLAAGVWELADGDSDAAAYIGLSSGVVSAGLGGAAIVPRARVIRLSHARNLLAPIVRGEDPDHLYPTFVFRMLLAPVEGQQSPRERLLGRFDALIADALDDDDRALGESILYGEGGYYDVDLLELRIALLDELETTLEAFDRDLELVQRYVGRTFDAALLGARP
jgi:hypothetical protein